MATRREVVQGLAVSLALSACRGAIAQPAEDAVYVGVETSAATGLSQASFFAGSGRRTGQVTLDFRAHGLAQHGHILVVFPRRPGNRFAVVDLSSLEVRAVVSAPTQRHFYGHGALTLDGRTLLVAENDLGTLQGHIGLYDIGAQPVRIGSLALPGAGPHEIIRAADRDSFYIALGGLETHPAYGRTPLNLDDFRSQILRLDLSSASVSPLGVWDTARGVSLRHLAADGHGNLVVGGQVVTGAPHTRDVLWVLTPNGTTQIETHGQLQGYTSSVSAHGRTAIVTSKKSGQALVVENGEVVRTVAANGASGAGLSRGLVAVSGYQKLILNDAAIPVTPQYEFDNHGLALTS
ncbi:MAG: DUF1513 domain-containing protein [Pseudomonadota bacterium]